ncbi:ATP-binding protein [Cohnella sp. REN36]|uniref:ATP-binding protein n=1 Tax=Cohnella sp. REN36 TaxID=2887347 RepID=UPI001D13B545|nr:ATP-binding protein [Cohnella sp. REN36]MCC3377343.1 PAS domain S-box protein [Cohnella sp. REN36]
MVGGRRIAGLIGLLLGGAFFVWIALHRNDPSIAARTGGDLFHEAVAIFALALTAGAYRRSGREKHWLFYACGAACYLVAQTFHMAEVLLREGEEGPFGASHVLWMVQYVFYLLAILHQYNRAKQAPSLRFLLDVLIFTVISVALNWLVAIQPLVEGKSDLPLLAMIYALYCCSLNAVLCVGLLILCLYERTAMPLRIMTVLIVGFLIRSIGTSATVLMEQGGDWSAWDWMPSATWFAGMLLLGYAGLLYGRPSSCEIASASTNRNWLLRRYVPLVVGTSMLMAMLAGILPAFLACLMIVAVALLLIRLFLAIYEYERANKALRESNLNYRSWAENALVGGFIELNGSLVYANRQLERMFGYEEGEMWGVSLEGLIAADDVAKFREQVQVRLARGSTVRFDVTAARKDRTPVYLEMQLTTTFYEGREALSGIALDITERKLSEQWLIRSEKLSVVGQLAAGVAHEIRNPLTALKGFTQLLHRNAAADGKYFEIMMAELDRINYIVGEFMVLSKPHHRPEQKTEDLHDILNGIVPIVDTQAILNNVEIAIVPPPVGGTTVRCDVNQIKQVLINLLKNAIEAMPDGGRIEVRYVHDPHKGEVTVRIEDDGPGIPPELLQRLGEPFFTTKEKGAGLGLMVCYKIVESHGGRLAIRNRPTVGAAVSLTLPVLAPDTDNGQEKYGSSALEAT